MKHLPNLLTLANLFCGVMATTYILTAQPFLATYSDGMPYYIWVQGAEQIYYGSILIFAAAVFDMLDGFTARALRVFSPIGKDLDSLADIVSFGVAPAAILFKLLWDALMMEPKAMDISILPMAPAFLIPCFAALRLAKFNQTSDSQKSFFIGMPTPAVGLFVASLPLVSWYGPAQAADLLKNTWLIYGVIAILGFLMVSKVRFMKLMPAKWQPALIWPQAVLLVVGIATLFVAPVLTMPILFILYIILSLVAKKTSTE